MTKKPHKNKKLAPRPHPKLIKLEFLKEGAQTLAYFRRVPVDSIVPAAFKTPAYLVLWHLAVLCFIDTVFFTNCREDPPPTKRL